MIELNTGRTHAFIWTRESGEQIATFRCRVASDIRTIPLHLRIVACVWSDTRVQVAVEPTGNHIPFHTPERTTK